MFLDDGDMDRVKPLDVIYLCSFPLLVLLFASLFCLSVVVTPRTYIWFAAECNARTVQFAAIQSPPHLAYGIYPVWYAPMFELTWL